MFVMAKSVFRQITIRNIPLLTLKTRIYATKEDI